MTGTVLLSAAPAIEAAAIARRVLGSATLIVASHRLKVDALRLRWEAAERMRYILSLAEMERQELAGLHALKKEMEPRPFIGSEYTRADRAYVRRRIEACHRRIGRLTTAFSAEKRKQR